MSDVDPTLLDVLITHCPFAMKPSKDKSKCDLCADDVIGYTTISAKGVSGYFCEPCCAKVDPVSLSLIKFESTLKEDNGFSAEGLKSFKEQELRLEKLIVGVERAVAYVGQLPPIVEDIWKYYKKRGTMTPKQQNVVLAYVKKVGCYDVRSIDDMKAKES